MIEHRFYIYIHKRIDNGVVFYVGKGTKDRLYSKRGRSKVWKEIVNETGGFIAEKLEDNLTNEIALQKESDLILNPHQDWILINKHVANKTKSIDISQIKELIYYDENSSSSLVWRVNRGSAKAGDKAGSITTCNGGKSYYQIRVNGSVYLVHRLVWALHQGSLASCLVIHHKDGNGLNNKIENLEAVTHGVNMRNTSVQNRELNGVHKRTYRNGKEDYIASWQENGKRHYKHFACAKYGEDKAKQLAVAYRKKKIETLNELGYDYKT